MRVPDPVLDQLDDLLRREIELYTDLSERQAAETQLAVAQKLEDFLANLQAKERLLQALSHLEQERRGLLHRLAAAIGLPSADVSLQTLCTYIPTPYAERLQAHRTRLRALVTELQQRNREHAVFLQDSLSVVDGILAFFASLLTDSLTYQPSGTFTPRTHGRLLSGQV